MDFLGLLKRLHASQAEFVVVGGYASMMLGSDMLTQDLDICIRLGSENLSRVFDAVEDLEPRYRMHPDQPVVTRKMATAPALKNLYLSTQLGPLDCLGSIKGLGDFGEVVKFARPIALEFGEIFSLYFDGLIRAKYAMNREKDRQTIIKLKAIQEMLEGK